MAFTKITGPGIHTLSNIMTHNVKSSGIITAVNGNLSGWLAVGQTASFGGDVSIGGTLTYDDVTNVEAVGIITAKAGIHVGAGGTIIHAVSSNDGKVGIGTTIPTATFEISQPSGTPPLIKLKRTTGNTGECSISVGGANPGVIFDAVGISSDFIFRTQGTEIMRIDSLNKEVGIGTDNPFCLLDVFRKATGTNKDIFSVRSHSGAFLVECSDVAASNPTWALRTFSGEDLVLSPGGQADVHEKVRIKASDGRVGINTNDLTQSRLDVFEGTGTNSSKALVRFQKDHTETVVTGARGAVDQYPHALILENQNNSANTGTVSLSFSKYSAGVQSQAIIAGIQQAAGQMALTFNTELSNTMHERLRIDSDGRVGMGLTSTSGATCDPDDNGLLIRHSSTFQTNHGHIMLTGDGSDVGQGPQIVFSESGSGANWAGAYIGHVRKGGGSQGDLVFGTRESTGSSSTVPEERLRIMQDGKVGIGTDDPNDKLSIHSPANSLILGAKETIRQNHIFQLLADDSAGNGELRLYRNSGSGNHQQTVEIASHGNSYFLQGNVGIGTNSISQPLTIRRSSAGQSEFGVRLEYSNLTGPTQTSSAFLVGSYGIKFKNYNSSRNFFFETGDVGIGTDNLDSSATLSICDKTGSSRIYMKSADDADCSIYFGRMSDSATAAIRYDHDVETLRFYGYNNTQKLYIDDNSVIVAESRLHASRVQAKFGIDCHNLNILDDVNDPSNYGMVFYNDPTTDKANGIGFFNDDGQSCGGYIVHQDKGGSNVGDIIFATSESANTPTERLRLTTKGNVVFKDNHSGHTGGGVYSRTKTVTLSGDNTSSFMRFTLDHGAIAGMIFLTASNSGYSVAKTLAFAAQYGQTVTTNLLADTGPYSGANVTFTHGTNNNQHTFMVEVSGQTQEVNMTVIMGLANQNITYTEL